MNYVQLTNNDLDVMDVDELSTLPLQPLGRNMNYSVQPSVASQVAVNTSSGALLTNVGGNNTMLTAVASVLNAPAALPNIPCNEISIFAVTNLQLSSGGSSAKINLVNGSIYTFVVSNANMIYLNNSQSSGALAVNYIVFS